MSDLFRNHIVGFPTRQLTFLMYLQLNTTRKAPRRRKRREMLRKPNLKKEATHQPGVVAGAGVGAELSSGVVGPPGEVEECPLVEVVQLLELETCLTLTVPRGVGRTQTKNMKNTRGLVSESVL